MNRLDIKEAPTIGLTITERDRSQPRPLDSQMETASKSEKGRAKSNKARK
jgi:hypothetical protein